MPKPLPILSQMPWHIQQDIICAADVETKFSVRQCSKQLKNTVDNSKMPLDSLSFGWKWGSVYSKGMVSVGYSQSPEGNFRSVEFSPCSTGFLQRVQDGSEQKNEKIVETGDYVDAGIEQFVKVLRRFPKLSLRRTGFLFRRYTTDLESYESQKRVVEEKLNKALKSLNRQIVASEVQVLSNDNADGVSQILSHFRPGTLEKITIAPDIWYGLRGVVQPINLNGVVNLEQWKRASSLNLYRFNLALLSEETAHFSDFHCYSATITFQLVEDILNNILRENGWNSREISTERVDYNTFIQYFLQPAPTEVYEAFLIDRGEFTCKVVINRRSVSFSKVSKRS